MGLSDLSRPEYYKMHRLGHKLGSLHSAKVQNLKHRELLPSGKGNLTAHV